MTDLLSHNQRLVKLSTLSPSAKQRLETESYRISILDDELDERAVLETLFCDLIQDFFTIGVEFHCTRLELYDSHHRVDQLIELAGYFLPQPLNQRLRDDRQLAQLLDHLLDGGGSEDGMATGIAYLHALGLDPDCLRPELASICHFLLDKLVTTIEFDRYLGNLLALGSAGALLPPLELSRQGDYLAQVLELEQRLQRRLDLLQRTAPYLDGLARLEKRCQHYIQALTQPDQLNQLSWMMLSSSLPEGDSVEASALRASYYQDFASDQRLHLEHYLSGAAPLDELALIGIAVRLAATSSSAEAFRASIQLIPTQCAARQISLTDRMMTLISLLTTTLSGSVTG